MAGLRLSLGLAVLLGLTGAAPVEHYALREGLNINSFTRSGPVAAHVVLKSGKQPRLLVAFPAGNSGTALWFEPLAREAEWRLEGEPEPVTVNDARGRPLHGVRFTVTIDAERLVPRQAVLSSIRVIRDYQALGTAPAEVLTRPRMTAGAIRWSRDRLDGAAGYDLAVAVTDGRIDNGAILAGKDGRIRFAVTALTGETPLTPRGGADLLNAKAQPDQGARNALTFLSYAEKFLAGSWRFDTYFGRDTLMSVRLLMPALQPAAVETGLSSVLVRLSPQGEVAHEEDIGEFAILDHRKADGSVSDAPVYNYNMVDSDYMLAPVARAWLLDDPRGRARAAAFLAQRVGGETMGARMVRNLRFVLRQAQPFARDPVPAKLIALKPGMDAGEWRDSNDGLAGGRIPYDVNAVLVPAALDSAAALAASGLLRPYLSASDAKAFGGARAVADIWRAKAPPLFDVTLTAAEARQAVSGYARMIGVPDAPALASIGNAPMRFPAIALDAQGRSIPVQNSDPGFALLFARPPAETLKVMASSFIDAFPAGLRTGVGMLVANPAFADAAIQRKFSPNAYHGTVVWSWQQALVAAGLARQLERRDLPADVRASLARAQSCLWDGIEATRRVQSSELWSWRYADGRYQVVPFGAAGADVDESNAAQLWSTVYLALRRPAGRPVACSGR
ncbi:hypothetical protein V3I01_06325 [Sphingomonas sp. gentR]|jgi:hypothetical protein|uniref:hypothetical protein n=1 Tax=unclassified Sphingomonas TaxID=196159 RepID=UPI000972BED7|nr:hypothetical protein [Sphingomonas sp. LK11]APX66007.1 hypothetical protein AV944_09335 [Sphingomonas sp. LK11]